MACNKSLLCLFGILSHSIIISVALEAIVNGDPANKEHQFPYQAAIFVDGYDYQCGGGIIGNRFILTAGHCVTVKNGDIESRRIYVVVGTDNLHRHTESVDVEKTYVPKNYHPLTSSDDDIAVLKLKRKLEHKHLQHLELPIHETKIGDKGKIAGFGWNLVKIIQGKEEGTNTDKHLRFSDVTVTSNVQCQDSYRGLKISKKHLCARVKQTSVLHPRGVCMGDSGGPLVHHDGKHVIGILSKSPFGCNEEEQPSVYTYVLHYLKFIEDSVHDKNNDEIRSHVYK